MQAERTMSSMFSKVNRFVCRQKQIYSTYDRDYDFQRNMRSPFKILFYASSSTSYLFLLVTIVSRNTLLIHYYTKILQNGHFVSQISPQEQHLGKKQSIPQCSQWKMLHDRNKKKIRKCILGGVNCLTIWAFLGFFQNIPKTPVLCGYLSFEGG